jgi:hygromycin-B 7''-O-kinase
MYSTRLGAITPQQFQMALARFGLGELTAAQHIESGLFGQNVFVTCTAGEWVLRGAPHYDWQFPTEEFFARLIHERTQVPVPWPYLRDSTTDIFGWEYVLMPRMPGVHVTHSAVRDALSARDHHELAHALGETLAELHTLAWPYPGKYTLEVGGIVALDCPWADQVEMDVHGWVDRARAHSDWTTSEDMVWVDNVLAAGRAAVEMPFTPRVVLPDYKQDNTTAQKDGDRWEISGVFDLMEASMGDGEMALCRQIAAFLDEQPALARTFVQAYAAQQPPRPGLVERLRVYMLDERLIMWEYGQRHPELGWWDARLALRAYVEPYLDAIPDVV